MQFKVGDWVKLLPEVWERNRRFPGWEATKDKSFLVLVIEANYSVLILKDFPQARIFGSYFELSQANDYTLDRIEA